MIANRVGTAVIDPHRAPRTDDRALRQNACLITALFERLLVWATRNNR